MLCQFAFENRARRRGSSDTDVHGSTPRKLIRVPFPNLWKGRNQLRYMNEGELVLPVTTVPLT